MLQVTYFQCLSTAANKVPVKRIQAGSAVRVEAWIGTSAGAGEGVPCAEVRNRKVGQRVETVKAEEIRTVKHVEEICP